MTFNSKIYETLLTVRSDSYKYILPSLETVADFIKEKKRILYGGMAIDMALKKAGAKGIYNDDDVPDYDFYSPDSVADSNELADILDGKDLPGISSINGLHHTTRRVRTNFVSVADISYVPPHIYDKIPSITYNGFNIAHPHYQMIDQHRALSYPYENPPLETAKHRIKKDITRYNLLSAEYPIEVDMKYFDDEPDKYIQLVETNGSVLAGIYAYAYYHYLYPISGVIKTTIDKEGVHIPSRYADMEKQIIITDDFQHFTKDYTGKIIYRSRLSGLIPRSCEREDCIIYDNKGEKIAANEVAGKMIVGAHWTMGYCLSMYFIKNDVRYLEIYKSISILIDHLNKNPPPKEVMINCPLLVNPHTYGDFSWSVSHMNQMRDKYSQIYQISRPKTVPENYYPARGVIPKSYDYTKFEFGGEEIPPFHSATLYE